MGKRIFRSVLIVLGTLLAVLFVGPFLIPIPPLEGTLPPDQLADPDSQFVDIHGVSLHYKEHGEGDPAFVLLHGFGASEFSWRAVVAPLSTLGRVIAFDRPAFGLTERPLPGEWSDWNPYRPEAQVDLTIGLMDRLGVERAILVGHSAGGSISMLTALAHPDRVAALVLVDPAVYGGGGAPDWLRPILYLPQAQRLGPLLVRSVKDWGLDTLKRAWHDPARITPEILRGYTRPLQADNWDQGLWQMTLASHGLGLADRLDAFELPVLVITGDDDRIVPAGQSIRLAGELPNAELVVIPNCGHVSHEECPAEFMRAVAGFVNPLR